MEEAPISDRLLDQRLRNRVMEELLSLSKGDQPVREWGAGEYFEAFFDWFPHDRAAPWPNTAMTEPENSSLAEVHRLMKQACDETPRMVGANQLIETGWPSRIAPVAADALSVFMARGRFSEDFEEETPSNPTPWP